MTPKLMNTGIRPQSAWRLTRMVTLLGLLAGILPTSARGQNAPIPPEIEDLQVTDINKEAAHAILMPYQTLDQALAGQRRLSPWARDLNGAWKFNWVKRPEERPVDFYKPDYDVSAWKTIRLPRAGRSWATEPPITATSAISSRWTRPT
jgi:hypothetical protein